MMIRKFIVFFLFLITQPCFAATNMLTEKVRDAYELYSIGNYEDAARLFKESYFIMENASSNDLLGKFKIAFYLGLSYRAIGDYTLASNWFTKALTMAKTMQDKPVQATILAYLGEMERLNGNYDRAVKIYLEAVSNLFISLKDKAVLYYGLAETYRLQKDYDNAKDSCIIANNLAADLQLEQLKLSCELIKADSFKAKEEYATALQTFNMVRDMARARNYPNLTIAALNGMGLTAEAIDRKDAARAYFDEALAISIKNEIYDNVELIADKLSSIIPQGDFTKQTDEIISIIQEKETLPTHVKVALWRLAAVYAKATGNNYKAFNAVQNAYQESLVISYDSEETISILYDMAEYMFILKRYHSAIVRLDEALSRCKDISCNDSAKIYALKAENLLGIGKISDAVASMEEAAKLDTKYSPRLESIRKLIRKENLPQNGSNFDNFEKDGETPVG